MKHDIHLPADAREVINKAGISESTWCAPGSFEAFVIFVWSHAQSLDPCEVPAELESYLSERYPLAQAA